MKKLTPSDSVFNKLYLLNLLSDRQNKSLYFIDGAINNPVIYKMIGKLNDIEIETLINKIENL